MEEAEQPAPPPEPEALGDPLWVAISAAPGEPTKYASVDVDAARNIYLGGATIGANGEGLIAETLSMNPTGELCWTDTFFGATSAYTVVTSDDSIAGVGSADLLGDGTAVVWADSYLPAGTCNSWPVGVVSDSAGDIVVAGHTQVDCSGTNDAFQRFVRKLSP